MISGHTIITVLLEIRHLPEGNYYYHRRRPPKWKTIIIALIILIFVSLVLFCGISLNTRLQKYTFFTNGTEVAELTILKSREGEDRVKHQVNSYRRSWFL